jgi:hypothetical protein
VDRLLLSSQALIITMFEVYKVSVQITFKSQSSLAILSYLHRNIPSRMFVINFLSFVILLQMTGIVPHK